MRTSSSTTARAEERTPLIPSSSPSSSSSSSSSLHKVHAHPDSDTDTHAGNRAALRRVLFVALVSATSFAFTQTSLIYAFRVMTCDEYYARHDLGGLGPVSSGHEHGSGVELGMEMEMIRDRCSIPSVESSTAKAIALMSTNTTFCCTSLFSLGSCLPPDGRGRGREVLHTDMVQRF